jgi:hypothetical protein
MKFMLVIYNDSTMVDALAQGAADGMMRECLTHADELRRDGRLTESQMLEDAVAAKSVRIRNGRVSVTDGPFSEAKEVLGGFNLIEARDARGRLARQTEGLQIVGDDVCRNGEDDLPVRLALAAV